MVQYEALPTLTLDLDSTSLCTDILPEIFHQDDPAITVMTDFTQVPAKTINKTASIDDALHRMKVHGAHRLFVVGDNEQPVGIIASEDILGELPIKIQQQRRIPRSKLQVAMLMTDLAKLPALDVEVVAVFKIGNIISTLKKSHCHYLLVVKRNDSGMTIRGIFSESQICQQLHQLIE